MVKIILNCVALEILLHYNYKTTQILGSNQAGTKAQQTALRLMVNAGLLSIPIGARRIHNLPYKITDKGRVHCDALQRVALPVQKWMSI